MTGRRNAPDFPPLLLPIVAPDGRRRILYLGKLPLKQAQTVKSYTERLLLAAASGDNIDTDTAGWLTRITDELHGKLACGRKRPG
jgi:hypothetical protein